jgi:hypothetical protein
MAKPSKADFEAFEKVRARGRYNMMMDSRAAAKAAGLTMERYFDVLEQYGELATEYAPQA